MPADPQHKITRARVFVCSAVATRQVGMTTHVDPFTLVVLAASENDALGAFMKWVGDRCPDGAVHKPLVQAVPDNYIRDAYDMLEPIHV